MDSRRARSGLTRAALIWLGGLDDFRLRKRRRHLSRLRRWESGMSCAGNNHVGAGKSRCFLSNRNEMPGLIRQTQTGEIAT
jgi:hypothetical protein